MGENGIVFDSEEEEEEEEEERRKKLLKNKEKNLKNAKGVKKMRKGMM